MRAWKTPEKASPYFPMQGRLEAAIKAYWGFTSFR